MVRKKTGNWFEDENIQRFTVKGKYIVEKEKANLIIPTEEKFVGQKKKKHR